MRSILLLVATPALATDGVLEINQTCDTGPGCFTGDAPGFPVYIQRLGTSYILTSPLIVPDNADGIVIYTSDFGIDLNNFAIIRSGCEGVTTNSSPTQGARRACAGRSVEAANLVFEVGKQALIENEIEIRKAAPMASGALLVGYMLTTDKDAYSVLSQHTVVE